MRPKLTLSLSGTHLSLELTRPAAGGLHGLLNKLCVVRSNSPDEALHEVAPRVVGVVGTREGDLRTALDDAMAGLRPVRDRLATKLDFEVQLGFCHSRVGVMQLDGIAAMDLSDAMRETYVQAWVRHTQHVDPQAHIIRWQILADAHKFLISCVDRAAFEALSDFAVEHRLRFTSCRPAILSAAEMVAKERAAKRPAAPRVTAIWTERDTAARSSLVQLLRLEGRQLCSTWRGWIPDGDSALEGAIRRFQAWNIADAGEEPFYLSWPSAALQSA